jgi:chromosome segregation ATPase
MEFEEIIKRVEWLDDQHRKSRTEFHDINGRLTALGGDIKTLSQQVKNLTQQLKDLSVAAARMNQFDQMMGKHRTDLSKMIDTVDKNAVRREQEAVQLRHAELEETRKTLFELRNSFSADETARKERGREEQRRAAAFQDMRASIDSTARQTKDILEAQKALEDGQRQESKRTADLQAELAALRKQADETREKITLHGDIVRSLETRVGELAQAESSRQEQSASFLQQQALAQVERDRAWKDWQQRYEAFKQQSSSVESQVASFEDAIRAAQRAQEAYDGLNQRLERRIAEVGEVQRLAEERLRQEWVAFKADEQKRWAGHSLAQEETVKDLRRDVDKMEQRLTSVDDAAQSLQDQLQQTTETTETQLQELMNVSQEWLSAYERIMGHARTKVKKSVR